MDNFINNLSHLHFTNKDDILYTYNNIYHITNRSKFNTILKEFLTLCNEINIIVITKNNSSYNIMKKQVIIDMITKQKQIIIQTQMDALSNINFSEPVTLKYIECMINTKEITEKLTILDHLQDLVNEVYDNNLLQLDNYTKCTADKLYDNYVDFVKIRQPIKFVEKYTMITENN